MDIESAFKLFDIRGDYPQVVDERLAFIIGKALVLLRHPHKVLVASDTRESSPALKNLLIAGLSFDHAQTFDLGEVPIPQFYFAVVRKDYDLGVIITASHVSETENGFKIINRDGLPFDQGEMSTLKNLAGRLVNDSIITAITAKTAAERINTTEAYVQAVLSLAGWKNSKLKIVLDMTRSSVVTPALLIFSRLGVNFVLTKSERSGNPLLAQNRRDLAKTVLENSADLGIMWDSDGDRCVFVDRAGQLIPLSFVLGILAAGQIKKSGQKAAVDIRAGLVVRDLVTEAGGAVEVFPAWSQVLKFAMREDPAIVFAGETSGHFIFRDFHSIDDGLLAALRFLCLWQERAVEKQLRELGRRYFELPEQNFDCREENAAGILENLTEYYRQKEVQISIIDGLTVFGPDYKFNLRPSLTEPYLRLNLEARSQKRARQIAKEIEDFL